MTATPQTRRARGAMALAGPAFAHSAAREPRQLPVVVPRGRFFALSEAAPRRRLIPETRTSAFGALATTVPSASRTTMSRIRTAVPPFSVRSICVPPTSTWWPLPKFSSMAEASHGVITSSWIGPLVSRHHSARHPTMMTAAKAPSPIAVRRNNVAWRAKNPQSRDRRRAWPGRRGPSIAGKRTARRSRTTDRQRGDEARCLNWLVIPRQMSPRPGA